MSFILALIAIVLAIVALLAINAVSSNVNTLMLRMTALERRRAGTPQVVWRVELMPKGKGKKPQIIELENVANDSDATRQLLLQKVDIGRIITMGPVWKESHDE